MICIWITKRREHIPVQAMERSHIESTLAMIKSGRMAAGRTACNGFTNAQWVQIFEAELQRRNRQGMLT
jgi:hypothetical protein